MGLLTDPSLKSRSKLGRKLAQHSRKICLIFYIAGIVWFISLAHPNVYHNTYLSENALSPGLVYPEMKQDSSRLAHQLNDELRRERENHKSTTPYSWIIAKMKQIGLETHVHNFTLHYPFAGGKEYHGKNIYGILRAPRIGSTEGIVFTAPYRAATSVHADITPSVPTLLAFADFARRKNYWAKDLIFLVTEQEQLGMHAWLEAYYEGGIKDSSVLNCGNLPARAGSLQAALNLEIQDFDIEYIDVKIEGLNGQLPNLDLFNVVQRIMVREGISSGYKNSPRKKRNFNKNSIEANLRNMMEMLLTQSTGVPTGNHGLFHRYRIESLTLEAVKRDRNGGRPPGTLSLLKAIEGISRSLNNLLERFHQSFFFYILVHNDHFVSIGDFMPSLMLMVAPLFFKAFLLWLSMDYKKDDEAATSEHTVDEETKADDGNQGHQSANPFVSVLLLLGQAFIVGLMANVLPLNEHLRDYFAAQGVDASNAVALLVSSIAVIGTLFPFVVRLPASEDARDLLHIAVLVFSGVALIVTGLLNFALGLFLGLISGPLLILLSTEAVCGARKALSVVYTLVLSPAVAVYLLVFVLTAFQFPEMAFQDMALRALTAAKDAVTYALMDCIIYGNWLYTAITAVFFPLWINCWCLVWTKPQLTKSSVKEKRN